MKRIFIALMLFAAVLATATAQSGLKINQLFTGDFASDPAVTMTVMSGESHYLSSRNLNVMATFKAPAEKFAKIVEPMVLADGAHSVGKNVRYKKGVLHYAFYSLPKAKNGKQDVNRYIYYLNGGPLRMEKVTVVYFEGPVTQEEASRLIRRLGN